MKVMIITTSPNKEGLTAACGEAAKKGLEESGVEVILVPINDLNIGSCHACGNGWGPCLKDSECQIEDDFQKLHALMLEIDGFILVTPVYWGEMSESAKAFTDRLRRCEAINKNKSYFQDKPVICVAAAGGTGNGVISCLASMERFVMHVKGTKFDFLGITRNNREYMLNTIVAAAKKLGMGQNQ